MNTRIYTREAVLVLMEMAMGAHVMADTSELFETDEHFNLLVPAAVGRALELKQKGQEETWGSKLVSMILDYIDALQNDPEAGCPCDPLADQAERENPEAANPYDPFNAEEIGE